MLPICLVLFSVCKVSFIYVNFGLISWKAPITNHTMVFSGTSLQVMMALSVCEYFYIYLGDLTRYYQQYIQDKPDWSKPRRYVQADKYMYICCIYKAED